MSDENESIGSEEALQAIRDYIQDNAEWLADIKRRLYEKSREGLQIELDKIADNVEWELECILNPIDEEETLQ